MITAGIDAGSRTIKVALFDTDEGAVIATGARDQGVRQAQLSLELFERLLAERGLLKEDVARIVATGYGRNRVDFAHQTITEITCHARGVRHLAPEARTIIEIGGQDSKVIRLDAAGKVHDFAMNDRCAAGTGRFLEMVATRLETNVEELGALARRSTAPAAISSMCVVFAETEIIGLLAQGSAPEDIVAGVQTAVARRVVGMMGRSVADPVVFTGGVALVTGMSEALARALAREVQVACDPWMTGAIGAALL